MSLPSELTDLSGALLFTADDGTTGRELWRSDGTSSGTWRVRDINANGAGAGLDSLTNVNGRLFFTADANDPGLDTGSGVDLWSTDGTAASTLRVADLPAADWPYDLESADGVLFFLTLDQSQFGLYKLWKSTPTTTSVVKAFFTDPFYFLPGGLTARGRDVAFLVGGGGQDPTALWKTDGTASGTTAVAFPATTPFNFASANSFRNVGGTFFVTTRDWETPAVEALWKSEATWASSVRLAAAWTYPSGPRWLTDTNGRLFFAAGSADGVELWTSDGTPSGTVMVKDLRAGSGSDPQRLTDVDGVLYFTADDGVHGRELWKSDGTAAGTVLVKDLRAGVGSDPQLLTHVNGTVYFTADDGVHGRELWRSDGTPGGTVLVRDIRTDGSANPSNLTNVDGVLYFAADDSVTGVELWRSDGTAGGTTRVADLRPGSAGSLPSRLTNVNGTLFFVADDGSSGPELWKVAGPPSVPALRVAPALKVGGAATITGRNFTPGAVVKLFVATAAGPAAYGPYVPVSWSPTALGVALPADMPLGNGFAAVQVINADAGYRASNVAPALLVGEASAGVPTITQINGVGLGPAELSIGVAHIDTVLAKGAPVTIAGTGFADPVVSVFTATGKVDLVPAAWTATSVSVVLPAAVPTGPGTFRVVNRPTYRDSNAVAAVIGAVPTITSVSVADGVVTVTGTGFCALTVINLYNRQGGGVVNLGGIGPAGARIRLEGVTDTQFSFARPAGAVAGPAFVEALNPPFIPFSSSGSDPDGAFTMLAAAPLSTEERSTSPGLKPRGSDGDADGDADEDAPGDANGDGNGDADGTNDEAGTGELVTWTRAVGAAVGGDRLRGRARGPAPTGTTDGTASGAARSGRAGADGGAAATGAGARSTRALLAGDGAVTWTVRADAGDVAFGFGDADRDGSLADLAFAWRLDPATRELQVDERGVRQAAVGTYAPGDRLRIAVRTGGVEYWRNGALAFTSKTAPTYPLVVDASLASPEATLRGVRLAGRLGRVIDWVAAPGVTTSSMAVAADGDTWADADRAGTGAVDRAGTGAGPYTVRGMDGDGDTGADAGRAGARGAVSALLRGAAGIGFGATDCVYCIIRVDDRTVQVRHAGAVRGTWSATAGTRVRIEVAGDGLMRYWAGQTLLDECGKGDTFLFPEMESVTFSSIRGWLGSPQSAIIGATSAP